jgi:hypothetical protein
MDEATVDACPFFPGSKVGKTFIFILFDYFGGVVINRLHTHIDMVRTMIACALHDAYSRVSYWWTGTVFSGLFC